MRIPVSVLMASVTLAAPAYASNDQVQRGPAPAWVVQSELMPVPDDVDGLAFVRRNDFLVHLDQEVQSQYTSYRIKILHSNALQLGNLSIAWNPEAGPATIHEIKVYRDGKAIDVLENTLFNILRREDQLEAAQLDGILTAVLPISDLRVGDELEVSHTIQVSDPTLGSNKAGLLFLAPNPVAGRYRLGLSWEKGQEPGLKMTGDMADVAKRRERGVEFRFDNPAMSTPPKDAPPRYNWQRVVEFSDFPDWASISRLFRPLYDKAATLEAGSPLKEEARRIAAAYSNPFDRASAALKLVQQQVRYIYVGLDGGHLTPATADQTWQRRHGDCKGKTALLLALLAELSIEADPVLASNAGSDDGLDARLPNPSLFDHVLVRARIAGTDYWLDGTLPAVAPPSAAPIIPYRWVLPVTARGSTIERREWSPPERPDEINLYEIDARAGFDEPARIISTTIVRGIKGLQQQVLWSGLATGQLLNNLRQQLVGNTWQAIDDVQWRYDEKAQASVLTISGSGSVDWADDGDGAKSLSLPGGGFNPPERRVRAATQDQSLPFYSEPTFNCHVTTVRLPQTTKPEEWSYNSQFSQRFFGRNYYRAFEIRDRAIRMVRGSRTEQPEIDPDSAKRDNARIGSFDNSMARIYYEPASEEPADRSNATVPTTYEIDWTANMVPCLATTKGD